MFVQIPPMMDLYSGLQVYLASSFAGFGRYIRSKKEAAENCAASVEQTSPALASSSGCKPSWDASREVSRTCIRRLCRIEIDF